MKVIIWRAEYYGALTAGGFATYYISVSNAFKKLGHEVIFVASGEMTLDKSIKFYNLRHNNLLRNFPEILNLTYNIKAAKFVANLIDIEKPDLVYLQNHDFQILSYLVKKKYDIPFLMHVDGIGSWVKQNWGSLYLRRIITLAERIQYHFSDAIGTPSQEIKDNLLNYGVEDKITVLQSSVDPDFFTPEKDGTYIREKFGLNDNFVCGFAGTFGNWHGVDTIAESINYIVEQIPNAKVFLIGDGPLRPEIERIIDANNSRENVIITGMIEFAEMPNYMAACDVLLTPCKNNDDNSAFFNSPLKLYEYMAMEKPIVASFIGQQAEVIEDKVNGVAIKANDVEDLVRGIKFVYDNPELSIKMSKQARKDAIEKYSWEIHVKKIIKIYEDIMAKKLSSKKSQ